MTKPKDDTNPDLDNETGHEVTPLDHNDIATVVKTGEKRLHKATFARDKIKGGFCIRVIGPNANRFAGKIVPVVKADDTETLEQLSVVIWTGIDTGYPARDGKPAMKGTGLPVALYTFVPKPAMDDEILF